MLKKQHISGKMDYNLPEKVKFARVKLKTQDVSVCPETDQ